MAHFLGTQCMYVKIQGNKTRYNEECYTDRSRSASVQVYRNSPRWGWNVRTKCVQMMRVIRRPADVHFTYIYSRSQQQDDNFGHTDMKPARGQWGQVCGMSTPVWELPCKVHAQSPCDGWRKQSLRCKMICHFNLSFNIKQQENL